MGFPPGPPVPQARRGPARPKRGAKNAVLPTLPIAVVPPAPPALPEPLGGVVKSERADGYRLPPAPVSHIPLPRKESQKMYAEPEPIPVPEDTPERRDGRERVAALHCAWKNAQRQKRRPQAVFGALPAQEDRAPPEHREPESIAEYLRAIAALSK
jgi:hypothetical protein